MKEVKGRKREKGYGGICKRENGSYEGTYMLHRKNGTKFEKSFTRNNKNEIIDIQSRLHNLGILDNNVRDVKIDRYTNEIKIIKIGQDKNSIGLDKDILVKDYLQYYLYVHRKNGIKNKKVEDSTFNNYCERAKYIEKYLGDKKVNELVFEDFEEFLDNLSGKLVDTTLRQIRTIAEKMMLYAKKDGIVDEYLFAEEKINIKESKKKKEKKIIQKKDIKIFIDYCIEHNYIILLMLLCTGARASEMAGLTWEDLDLNLGIVDINKQYARVKKRDIKNKKEVIEYKKEFKNLKTRASYRKVCIDKKMIEILKEHKKRQIELAKKKW